MQRFEPISRKVQNLTRNYIGRFVPFVRMTEDNVDDLRALCLSYMARLEPKLKKYYETSRRSDGLDLMTAQIPVLTSTIQESIQSTVDGYIHEVLMRGTTRQTSSIPMIRKIFEFLTIQIGPYFYSYLEMDENRS